VDWEQLYLDKARQCQEMERHRQEMERHCQEMNKLQQEVERLHQELKRLRQDMDRLPQDSQLLMVKLLANEAALRDIMLQHEKLREGILKSKMKYNMAALRAAGDVSAKAALEACYRKVVAENPMLLQMQDQPDSWETVWNVVFNDPRYHELKRRVDRHMDAEEKRSYGEIIADIYRKLREDVNKSADV
jgi:hypothetical protein